MRVRILYAAAGVLALLGLWLRLARSALPPPRADAAELPAPAAGRGAPAPAQQAPDVSIGNRALIVVLMPLNERAGNQSDGDAPLAIH